MVHETNQVLKTLSTNVSIPVTMCNITAVFLFALLFRDRKHICQPMKQESEKKKDGWNFSFSLSLPLCVKSWTHRFLSFWETVPFSISVSYQKSKEGENLKPTVYIVYFCVRVAR